MPDKKLGIEFYQGCNNKIISLKKIANEKVYPVTKLLF